MVLLTAFLALLLTGVAGAVVLPADAELLQQAEEAYQEGVSRREQPEEARIAFRRAAQDYELLRQRGANNAALFLNQGNAYLLGGDLPHAILAYRRGRSLDPDDRALRQHLEAARELAYAGISPAVHPPVEDWPPWLPRPAPRYRLLLAALLLALAWAALARWRMTPRGGFLAAGAVSLLLGAVFLSSALFETWLLRQERAHPLVVVGRDRTVLRRGDGDEYPPREQLPPLNAGVEGRLLARKSGGQKQEWLQIELAGGEVGWVRKDQVLLDEP